MTADTSIADETRKEMAAELRRYARQASEAAGSFIRWSVYLETDTAAAIMRMRKVLTTERTDTTSPFLPLIAEMTLTQLDPAAVKACRERYEQLAREKIERKARWAKSRLEWDQERKQEKEELKAQVAEALAGRIKDRTDNVVSVEFGGVS